MDRPTCSSGFTLLEACAVLILLGIVSLFFLPVKSEEISAWHTFPDGYLQKQSEAIRRAEHTVYEPEDGKMPVIEFNEKGNIRKAMTLYFPERSGRIVIELGGGRLVFRR